MHKLFERMKASRSAAPDGFEPLQPSLWPVGLSYANPMRAVFACDLDDAGGWRSSQAEMIARDGFIPLLWFFHRYPEPGEFGGRLFVHDSLIELVPEAWQARVGTYRLEISRSPRPLRELLFFGHSSDLSCSLDGLDDLLVRTRSALGAGVFDPLPKAVFYADHRGSRAGNGPAHVAEFLVAFGAKLASIGTGPVRATGWDGMGARHSFTGCGVVALNQGLLCADDAMLSLTLARGGQAIALASLSSAAQAECAGQRFDRRFDRRLPLSPHHALRLTEAPGARSWFADADKHRRAGETAGYFSALDGIAPATNDAEIANRHPWPAWFTGYARALATGFGWDFQSRLFVSSTAAAGMSEEAHV